ncbi:MAG: bifunctional nuclease family protein [Chloroflexi bacterium]|nr:bifunctional nuclease family protein [Chloroflexota bacterium]MBI2980042.1 bifunctional nuclease family protein [Chloroflexota bacterium]
MIEMTIDSIRVSLMNYQRVVILKEKMADRYLPIWIGPAEADAIAVKLQGVSVPRPLTHDLLCSVISAFGANVKFITVSELKNDTFYAKITLNVDGGQMEVDARPSDALALAVRVEAPVYVEESVLDKAGILLDKETGKPLASESGGTVIGGDNKISEEEMKKLSAFRDFINTLDWEDFDKRKS